MAGSDLLRIPFVATARLTKYAARFFDQSITWEGGVHHAAQETSDRELEVFRSVVLVKWCEDSGVVLTGGTLTMRTIDDQRQQLTVRRPTSALRNAGIRR